MNLVELKQITTRDLEEYKRKTPDVKGIPVWFTFDFATGKIEVWPPPIWNNMRISVTVTW